MEEVTRSTKWWRERSGKENEMEEKTEWTLFHLDGKLPLSEMGLQFSWDSGGFPEWRFFLGADAKSRKESISFVMSVRAFVRRPSVSMEQHGSHCGQVFMKFDFWVFSWNLIFEYFHEIWFLSIFMEFDFWVFSWNLIFEYFHEIWFFSIFMKFDFWYFHEIWFLSVSMKFDFLVFSWNLIFEYSSKKSVAKFLVSINLEKNNGVLRMKTNIHFWPYLVQLFLEWEMVQTNFVDDTSSHRTHVHTTNVTLPPSPHWLLHF